MKAQVLKSFGGPNAFELSEVAKPVPQAGQVLVRVHATSINPLDYQVRRGDYVDYVPLPAITGHDVSGVVEAVGPGVTSFVPGDEVWYTTQIFEGDGSYAEYHVASESIIGKKPASLSHLEAASLTLVGGTVWEALVGRVSLRVGESILIHGGAGGVGHVAIQVAKAIGARVFTTVREANFEFARGLGADVVIDYKTQNFEDVLRDYDVVLHSQDGQALAKSLRVLKKGGRLISISGPPDPEFGKDIRAPGFVRLVMRLLSAGTRRRARKLGIGYSFLFMRAHGGQLQEITRLTEAGAIRPVIDKVFPFDATNEAMAYIESGRAKGKVVIKMR